MPIELSIETLSALGSLKAVVDDYKAEGYPLRISIEEGALCIYSAPPGYNAILDAEVSPVSAGNVELICREAKFFLDTLNLPY